MAVPPPPKEKLRKDLLQARRAHVAALSLAERCSAAILLREHVMPLVPADGPVALYLPHDAEIDSRPLVAALAEREQPLALPHYVSAARPPRFLAYTPGDALFEGPAGLCQPAPDAAEVAPVTILAPLVGFDAALSRLGYGSGFYDKSFARFPAARRIGLAWSCQEADAIPADPWDEPLHAVVTEQKVF